MIKILYIIFLSLIVTNCSFKKVVKHHGVPFLEKKQSSLVINKTNKNDILKILGNPSTRSKFDNDVWIYIERKQTQSKLTNLGKMKIYKNNALVLEIDNYGILKKKYFFNKKDMNKINNSKKRQQIQGLEKILLSMTLCQQETQINDLLIEAKKRNKVNHR
jgi:outer membrane protein assembly factor BamE (lipoprotein component of BamABCDE complex)